MKLFLMLFLLMQFFLSTQNNQLKALPDIFNLIKKNVRFDWAKQTVNNYKVY